MCPSSTSVRPIVRAAAKILLPGLCGSTGRPRLSITPLHARKTSTSGSHRAFLLPLLHYCPYVLRENHRFSNISPHVSTTSASYESKRHHPSSSPFPPSAAATSIEARVGMYHRNRVHPPHTYAHHHRHHHPLCRHRGLVLSSPWERPGPPTPPLFPRAQPRADCRSGRRASRFQHLSHSHASRVRTCKCKHAYPGRHRCDRLRPPVTALESAHPSIRPLHSYAPSSHYAPARTSQAQAHDDGSDEYVKCAHDDLGALLADVLAVSHTLHTKPAALRYAMRRSGRTNL